jgi:hypothetical protein
MKKITKSQRGVSRKAAAGKSRPTAPRSASRNTPGAAKKAGVNPSVGNVTISGETTNSGRPCKICSDAKWANTVIKRINDGWSNQQIADALGIHESSVRRHRLNHLGDTATAADIRAAKAAAQPPTAPAAAVSSVEELASRISPLLKRAPMPVSKLAEKLGATVKETKDALHYAKFMFGALVVERGGEFHLDDAPSLGLERDAYAERKLVTAKDGTFTFAIATDMHLCSKYERLDCLNDFYDQVEKRGITTVLNAGNWIDGEATFNRNDLLVHGMDAQMQYLAAHYPQRDGVTTLAITGADHEGWYARREGVDVGRYAENVMRQNGREDWHDIGYMERSLPLVHYGSGLGSKVHVMHPGGGSAYAISYTPQKIIESFDGGDKPAALVLGHYHKADYLYTRNVHAMQGGCFQGQTVFMRQKRLSAAVGGCFVTITVDPRTGAFIECSYTFRNYFVESYYNGQWSQHGSVVQTKRKFVP